jgi:hypothetical protein
MQASLWKSAFEKSAFGKCGRHHIEKIGRNQLPRRDADREGAICHRALTTVPAQNAPCATQISALSNPRCLACDPGASTIGQ